MRRNVQEHVGYRTQKRLSQKKQKKTGWRWVAVIVALVILFVILGALIKVYPFDKGWNKTYQGLTWMGRQVKSLWPFKGREKLPTAKWIPEGKKTANYLIGVTKQIEGEPVLTTLVLSSYDSESGKGSLIFFPYDLMVNVPGLGMDQLGGLVNLDEGRMSMTLVTIENLMGIEIDRYILGTDRDLRIMLNQAGETFPVDVPVKTSYKDPSLNVEVNLKSGKQNLSASTLASYLTYAPPGKEIELCKRQMAYAPEFFAQSRDMFDSIPAFVKKNANLLDTDASDLELTGIWQSYADLRDDNLLLGIIPVKEFKFEDTTVHRVDQGKLSAFIKEYVMSPSTMKSTKNKRYKVEILNGNGVPGIGEQVASKLEMNKFQVVNSANADSFEHPETVIIIYTNDSDMIEAAEQVQNSMEVGRVEVRDQTQDISDITIVVGKDYAQK
jgi:anionic cell wall polymer biosynthesis LytR-Cps2A-Psr (LCP) family protein